VLAVGAIGVVFGDIGTSPLYALKESFIGAHPLAADRAHIFGILSLIFWTMVFVVTIKYVLVVLRADNRGEGGSLALLALITRKTGNRRWTGALVLTGIAATALFYGDAIITPAISVLSAVEGLTVVESRPTSISPNSTVASSSPSRRMLRAGSRPTNRRRPGPSSRTASTPHSPAPSRSPV